MASASAEYARRLVGRRALVTGGGSGIGLATVRRLHAEGAGVVALDCQTPLAGRLPDGVPWVRCDVRDEPGVLAAVSEASERLGAPVNVAVNAAGVYCITPLIGLVAQDWDDVLATNLIGTFFVSRAVARLLLDAGMPGAIVTIASTAALVADATEPSAHYNASKAGVMALTRQMAAEWGPGGIRANAVCPGAIDTPMLRLTDDPDMAAQYLRTAVPLRRLGRPEEVAAAIAFLASPDAAYINGVGLPVDGGTTAL